MKLLTIMKIKFMNMIIFYLIVSIFINAYCADAMDHDHKSINNVAADTMNHNHQSIDNVAAIGLAAKTAPLNVKYSESGK